MALDMDPRQVDEMDVVDPRGTGRHARETRQTLVDVLDRLGRWRATGFEHFANQVDASAGRIVLVAEQNIGRTDRSTEPVMHAVL